MKSTLGRYLKLEEYKKDKFLAVELVVGLVAICHIVAAVYTCYSMLMVGRSLWLDEAMLAYSFSTRTIGELTASVFEWLQSSPVLYLYIVKIITLVFGNTEITLRSFSFVSYILSIACCFYISNNILKVRNSLIAVAYISLLPIMFTYASEFKPYMTDALVVLLVIVLYYLYSSNRLKLYWLTASYAILLWLSNPSCFFIGAVLLVEFAGGVLEKDKAKMGHSVLCGVGVLISFVVYYFYWLKPVIDAGEMNAFWEFKIFPLIPTSMTDLLTQKELTKDVVSHFGAYRSLILTLVLVGFFINIFSDKNKYIFVIYVGLAITLFASMLGMYPIMDRLVLFVYPLFSILFFYYVGRLYSASFSTNLIVLSLSFIIMISVNKTGHYLIPHNAYMPNQETNLAIDYIDSNIKEGEKLYVFRLSVPGFMYKKHYQGSSIGAHGANNVFLGKSEFDEERNLEDIKLVQDHAPIYVLTSHTWYQHTINPLLDSLRASGKLDLVYNRHDTGVYYYTQKADLGRAH